jgi:cbb3-type cytochrome oxidase subunit 3
MNAVILMSLRAAITLSLFALFVALIFWAWSPKRSKQFAEAANLVFEQTDGPVEHVTSQQERR